MSLQIVMLSAVALAFLTAACARDDGRPRRVVYDDPTVDDGEAPR